MSNLYRGPSIDASYQVSVHLVKRFQRRTFFFRNLPIRNKNCLWRPCLLMDRDKLCNLYRGPYIDASYQVSEYRQWMPSDGKSSHCLWQSELIILYKWVFSWVHNFRFIRESSICEKKEPT
jgi:hypothetical protein